MLLLACLGRENGLTVSYRAFSTPKGREAGLHVHLMPLLLQAEWLNIMSAMLLFFNSSFRGKEKDFLSCPQSFQSDISVVNDSGNG